jgi:hypothetical protein
MAHYDNYHPDRGVKEVVDKEFLELKFVKAKFT